MINRIFLLLFLYSTSCKSSSDNTQINKQDSVIYITSSIDTSKVINEIKEKYKEINAKISLYRRVELNIFEQSSEGGNIIAYYENAKLKKIVTTFYGETGKAINEYYFEAEDLIFALKSDFFYDKPIYEDGFKIVSIKENRYYFFKNSLIRWIDMTKKSISVKDTAFKLEAMYIREDILNYKQKLNNTDSNK